MQFMIKSLLVWLCLSCAYLPAPAPDWISTETSVVRRGVVAIGEAPAPEGIAGADMVAAAHLAGALDAWLAPALTPLGAESAKEVYIQVALVASVRDRWVDPADGRHFSRIVLRWEDVDKVIRRALHGDERLDRILDALPGRLDEDVEFTIRSPDWIQLKWAQVPEEMRRELPLSHGGETKLNQANEESKEDKDDLDEDPEPGLPPAPSVAKDAEGSGPTAVEPPPKGRSEGKKAVAPKPKSSAPKTKRKNRSLIQQKEQPEALGPSAPDAEEKE